ADLMQQDHRTAKAETLIDSISRAPIRVRSIDWGVNESKPAASVDNSTHRDSRPKINQHKLGARAKGDNLPPPIKIQQSPPKGTLFWAIRSYWYAIINGTPKHPAPNMNVTIKYDVGGSKVMEIVCNVTEAPPGRLFHSLAARSLIQTLEDEVAFTTDPTDKYWKECEIVRLGKTYTLASTQTSFVATMNGVGTVSNVTRGGPNLTNMAALKADYSLDFDSAEAPDVTRGAVSPSASSFSSMSSPQSPGAFSTRSAETSFSLVSLVQALQDTTSRSMLHDEERGNAALLLVVLDFQESNGAFETGSIESILFPSSGVAAVPAFLAVLEGREHVKEQIWFTICAIAFLQARYPDRIHDWEAAKSKGESFVTETLHCISGIVGNDSERGGEILADCLEEAGLYF
ncbi:hypothetical protein QBC40DRAFT_319956, partial [Triangularia verruculosa]